MQLNAHAVNILAPRNPKVEYVQIWAVCFRLTKHSHIYGPVKIKVLLVVIIVGCVFKQN